MTTNEYWEAVDDIEIKNPGEPLLATLQEGPSAINEIYLKAAKTRLPEEIEEPEPGEPQYDGSDETLRKLWGQRTQLFGKMNKQSNVFHECKTKEERSRNSKAILVIWGEIQRVKADISHYEREGALPEVVDPSDSLPENPVELSRKLNSIRARISQKKKQITEIAGLDAGAPGKQEKIDAAEGDLKQLKYLAGLAAEKLKTFEHG